MDRALAAAAYMATPKVRPTSNYPLELHYIRALFIQQNYRQCIHACRDVLRVARDDFAGQPLQKTFVLFYLALAYDELARVMHPSSQTKLPAFNSAEHYFLEAIGALPSTEDACIYYAHFFPKDDARFPTADDGKPLSHSASFTTDYQTWEADSSDANSFRTASSGYGTRHHSPSGESLRSRGVSAHSDFDDLESHSSFHEILEPSKDQLLQRDLSHVSLLHTRPLPPRPQLQTQGLKRQRRRSGSTTKPCLPSRFLSRTVVLHPNPHPPPRVDRMRLDKALPHLPAPLPSEPDSPVSPLDPYDQHSDSSTISPISPTTPPQISPLPSPHPTSTTSFSDLIAGRFDAHLSAIRMQLETHVALVQQAKQQHFRARASCFSAVQTSRSSLASTITPATFAVGKEGDVAHADSRGRRSVRGTSISPSPPTGMQQLRQFWSATTEIEQQEEKRRRIKDARERKWARARFQPDRYRDLAERALSEL